MDGKRAHVITIMNHSAPVASLVYTFALKMEAIHSQKSVAYINGLGFMPSCWQRPRWESIRPQGPHIVAKLLIRHFSFLSCVRNIILYSITSAVPIDKTNFVQLCFGDDIVWHIDPLLSDDSINSGRCYVAPATYTQQQNGVFCYRLRGHFWATAW
jgi:hypothetical protein